VTRRLLDVSAPSQLERVCLVACEVGVIAFAAGAALLGVAAACAAVL
jgi:hypothetical protein